MSTRPGLRSSQRGFSIIETMIAVTLLAGAVVSLAHLLILAARANVAARTSTRAAILAEQKLEQLMALAWAVDVNGAPVSDTTTNVAAFAATDGCPRADVGASVGLTPSPADALLASRDGYVDYVDWQGCGLGGGASPPPGAVFTRRWSIAAADGAPETLVLAVAVTDRGLRAHAAEAVAARMPGEAWLVDMKTRRTP